MFLLNY